MMMTITQDLSKYYTFLFLSVALFSQMMILIESSATGHYLGKKPSANWIAAHPAGKASSDIQAAECAFNLRISGEIFAYFEIDSTKANNHGAPYGTCYACTAVPQSSDLVDDSGFDVFFWDNVSGDPGPGTGPIRNPQTGTAGYEDAHGTYFDGNDPAEQSSTSVSNTQPNSISKLSGDQGTGTGRIKNPQTGAAGYKDARETSLDGSDPAERPSTSVSNTQRHSISKLRSNNKKFSKHLK